MKCLPVETKEDNDKKYVIFEDENLRKLINKILGQTEDYNPNKDDLATLTEISTSDIAVNTIQSLKGLEYAINLTSLDLNNQEIKDLSPITGLAKLVNIKVDNNNLGSLNLLTDEEKKFYANSIVNIYNNASSGDTLIASRVLDTNKDNIADLVLVFEKNNCLESESIIETKCAYVKILTFDNGEVKVLYNTESDAENAE